MTTGDAFDNPFDDIAEDPELDRAFAAAREERRAEEEEYTRAAARQWARHRDLLDVVRELQHRGDTLSVQVGETVFLGVIHAVGRDYVQMQTDAGRVDVALLTSMAERAPLPLLVRVIRRARAGGRRAEADAPTFRARLLEYDGEDIDAVVGSGPVRDDLRGRVIVGRDHLVVHDRDGGETYLPLGCVAWIRPWRE